MKRCARALLCVLCVSFPIAVAGTPAPPTGPILFFDSFEKANKFWGSGAYSTDMATTPQGTARKLEKTSWDKKQAWTQFRVNDAGLKLLGHLQSNQVYAGVKVYGTDIKEVRVSFSGYAFSNDDVKENQWNVVFCNVSQTTKDKKRPPADFKIGDIAIVVTSKSGNTPTAYIDDFIVTAGMQPAAAWPAAIAADHEKVQRMAMPAKHGFSFTDDHEALLRDAFKDANRQPKVKTVLALAMWKNGSLIDEALKNAMAAHKVSGVVLPPEVKTVNNFNDLRLFLPYMLGKTDSETLVIAPTAAQVLSTGVNEPLLISRRCLAGGTVPVWVLPAPPPGLKDDQKKKLGEISSRWSAELAKLGVPTVDAQFALKDPSKFMEGDEINGAGYDALAKLIQSAVAHIDKYARGRR